MSYLIAFAAGMLTLFSPCILPVLPFVFARNDRPFGQGRLPLLAGMAASFAVLASLGAVAASWVVQLNQWGRWCALAALALFAISLLLPRLAGWWSRPLVAWGERLARLEMKSPWLASALLGVATGLVWSPCAGPVLGAVLASAALLGPSTHTFYLLLSYAAGAAVALGLALRASAPLRAVIRMRWFPGTGGRRVAGSVMLVGVIVLATGLDTRVLAPFAGQGASRLEALLQQALPAAQAADVANNASAPRPSQLPVEAAWSSLEGGMQWLNSPPLSLPALRGKVVLVNFWTYSCVNCLRTLPYVKAWAEKYADRGLVVVGVHTPEFAFEKDVGNVQKALQNLKIGYPVVQDNGFRIWRNFGNQYWPALYFLDAQGRVRHHQFGEGGYAQSERVIEDLLRETGAAPAGAAPLRITADTQGLGLAADVPTLRSGETYLGYEKGDSPRSAAEALPLNTWTLAGNWTRQPEFVQSNQAGSKLVMRFQARDANLVLGPAFGQPTRFRLTLDGHPPGIHHGSDVDAEGYGVADATRLYQLIRQSGPVQARTVEIEFLSPGARGYAFTFG